MGQADNASARRNITDKIVIELFVESCVDRGGTADHEERIAVRRGAYDGLNTDIATASRTVLNEELLAEATAVAALPEHVPALRPWSVKFTSMIPSRKVPGASKKIFSTDAVADCLALDRCG